MFVASSPASTTFLYKKTTKICYRLHIIVHYILWHVIIKAHNLVS